ncbi:hypothetical protein [Segetibacter aerophilus]|uniref:SHOCT domain-containing protein n=1 Tax=Segetibacter aerophilus TaxID=670293 RepID=A0A512BGV0_9BACT|nr:hypothetical protein [Segetibacter aerophilus]GEO11105.1 hypothetical protein SAE01_36010 [Segetibacter aerophilus]
MNFTNRRYFLTQTFQIKGSSILVNRKTLFEEVEFEILFERLASKKRTEAKTNSNLFFTGIIFFIMNMFFLSGSIIEMAGICIVVALILIITSFIDKKRTITIAGYDGNNIVLYFTKSNKGEVSGFVDQLFKAANDFLLNKYKKIDKALPTEPQLDNIQFLRNREIISEEEYEALKDRLYGRDNISNIGFGNSN